MPPVLAEIQSVKIQRGKFDIGAFSGSDTEMRVRLITLVVAGVWILLGLLAIYFADNGFGVVGGWFMIAIGVLYLFSVRVRVFFQRNTFRPEVDAEDEFVIKRESIIEEVCSTITIPNFEVFKFTDNHTNELVYFEKRVRRYVALVPLLLSRKESKLEPQQVIGWGLAYFSPLENRWIATPLVHSDQKKTVDSLVELLAGEHQP